jgi:cytochrome P450/NADPH-cytochrome P450 reductase
MDGIRGYHPIMLDIAVQLTQKWERLNPDDSVDVPGDMTRLTLDTIVLWAGSLLQGTSASV